MPSIIPKIVIDIEKPEVNVSSADAS